MSDTRLLNWRLVVPDAGDPLLLLPADGETVEGATVVEPDPLSLNAALRLGPFRGVVASDLAAWETLSEGGAAALLRRLAELPAPGGWLYAAFPNRWIRGSRSKGLSLRRGVAVLAAAGLTDTASYAVLPDQRQPAWHVPLGRRAEMDFFLRKMVFPYAPLRSPVVARAAAGALQAARMLALATPHGARRRLVPAYALVARRAA